MRSVLKFSSKNKYRNVFTSSTLLLSVFVTACSTTKPVDIAQVPTPEAASLHRVPLEVIENVANTGQPNIVPTAAPKNSSALELAHLPAETSNKTKFSSKAFGVKGSPRITTSRNVRKGGGRYQVGKPYTIRGKKYYPKLDPNLKQHGLASWYGPNFHGRLTANGEVYDQYALSAAHPTMPLPSYAKVTNLENGSSVVVRVNDRGPFSKKRVIDLSARAARLLGYTKQGVAKVRVEYAGKAPLHGLDEERLIATYKPGSVDQSTIPAIARINNGHSVASITKPKTQSVTASSIVPTTPAIPVRKSLPSTSSAPRPTGLISGFSASQIN